MAIREMAVGAPEIVNKLFEALGVQRSYEEGYTVKTTITLELGKTIQIVEEFCPLIATPNV